MKVFGNRWVIHIRRCNINCRKTLSKVIIKDELHCNGSDSIDADSVCAHHEVSVLKLSQTAPSYVVNGFHVDIVDQLEVKISKNVSVGSPLNCSTIVANSVVIDFLQH